MWLATPPLGETHTASTTEDQFKGSTAAASQTCAAQDAPVLMNSRRLMGRVARR